MIKIDQLCFKANKNTVLAREIIKNISLTMHDGECIVIMGANGSGKTTLFNLISGVYKPDTGNIIVDNESILHWNIEKRASLIAHVLQNPLQGTVDNLTVFENLSFAAYRGKNRIFNIYNTEERRHTIINMLTHISSRFANKIDTAVAYLSGGERQIISILMALSNNCKLLLLDEITASLAPNTAEEVIAMTQKLIRAKRVTTLMITHNASHALKYSDRIVILKDGMISEIIDQNKKQYITEPELLLKLL